MKEQIWALDPLQAIFRSNTVDDLISKTLVGRRFSLFLLAGFALATLLLTSAGVYGVTSLTASQRTREFGIRMALGAKTRDIVGLVVGEGLTLATTGVVRRPRCGWSDKGHYVRGGREGFFARKTPPDPLLRSSGSGQLDQSGV